MKYIFIILIFLCEFASGQNLRKWSSDSTTNTVWGNWFYRFHPAFTMGTIDSLRLADYKLVKDSAVFDIYRTPGKDSLFFRRGRDIYAIKDSSGTANAWAQGGNSFGTTGIFGTNDNNAIDVELNNIVKHRFHVDGTLSLNSPTDQTAILYVNGRSRFTQVLDLENGAGLSALSGAQMNNWGALTPANSINWMLNNIYQNVNTTKNFFRIAADVESSAATTQTINQLVVNPVYNNTSGTSTVRGYYYNPTLTAITGTTNIAIESASGLWVPRGVRTGFGTYSILVHVSDSSIAQVPSTTFATQSALNDTAAAIRAHVSTGTYTPTLTNTTNIASSSVYGTFYYTRIGNTVTVTGIVSIDPTATSTTTQLEISLPIASNLTNFWQLTGQMGTNGGGVSTTDAPGGIIVGSTADDRAVLVFLTGTNSTANDYSIRFTYEVL